MKHDAKYLRLPVWTVTRKDVAILRQNQTVRQALDTIRNGGVGERIVYFYVVDEEGGLTGVLPSRRLLTAPLEQPLAEVMVCRVIAIPHTATVMEACELFVRHKFLAFPVVNEKRQPIGVLDVSLLTDNVLDVSERERMEEVFETIGLRISQVRGVSPWKAFRYRFPWLLATISAGTLCALLSGLFEVTLAKSLILTFFLTMVLGLGESVAIQSMTMSIQLLRGMNPSWRWYGKVLRREMRVAAMIGAAAGGLVGVIVWLWHGQVRAAGSIGSSVFLILCAACFFGLSIPTLLHALKLDPKIAAGPVTLAFTDITVLLLYFGLAAVLL